MSKRDVEAADSGVLGSVGKVEFGRPFHISRFGHIGINVQDIEASLAFYCDLLGFRVSDVLDFAAALPPEERPADRSGQGFFLRHAGDHHSLVLFPPLAARVASEILGEFPVQVTSNQISWQAGGLRQIIDGNRWMTTAGRRIVYSGRDVPGSNFHFYTPDDDGHMNEVFYGMEQIGWDGKSKPEATRAMIGYMEPPPIPHLSEAAELKELRAAGIDLDNGLCGLQTGVEGYDVDGILLARPFQIGKVGPIRLFVDDPEASLHFYRDLLGLKLTETVEWEGHRCIFLRANTEHHSVALYPRALRERLGLSQHSTLFSMGMQMRTYQQLVDAIAFLKSNNVTIRTLPAELFPGIDYCAFAIDPCGHAVQLYYYMEQIGWDGRPRPPELRRKVDLDAWPEVLAPLSDTYSGEPFLGPLG
jgi:catechol 2,3-dioxygenase-like lactoylglutathione lyase family enzyme